MERNEITEFRSASCGEKFEEIGVESLQFGEEIRALMSSAPPPETGSTFTALLELPASQAVELLHSTRTDEAPPAGELSDEALYHHRSFACNPTFPSNAGLLDRASRLSVFAATETSSIPSNSHKVKREPADSDSNPNSSPAVTDPVIPNQNHKSTKRKEREKKAKISTKKSKVVGNDDEKLPYVHVRARRGQATDSHSLAERARREKINARMKLLQELVPGCSKISGTAMVLDEIISHVQTLQRQVEILSMSLATVHPRIDFDLDSLLAAESGSLTDSNFSGVVMPRMWPEIEGQFSGSRQHSQQLWHFDGLHQPVWGGEEDNPNFIAPEISLLSYDSSANSDSLQPNQLKVEL